MKKQVTLEQAVGQKMIKVYESGGSELFLFFESCYVEIEGGTVDEESYISDRGESCKYLIRELSHDLIKGRHQEHDEEILKMFFETDEEYIEYIEHRGQEIAEYEKKSKQDEAENLRIEIERKKARLVELEKGE